MNYCVDCKHCHSDEVASAVTLRTDGTEPDGIVLECSHPDNLDPVTKVMRGCDEAREQGSECGLGGDLFERLERAHRNHV